MTQNITASPYVKPIINYTQDDSNTIQLKMDYVNAIQSAGVNGLVEQVL